jgi:hypothetical protein
MLDNTIFDIPYRYVLVVSAVMVAVGVYQMLRGDRPAQGEADRTNNPPEALMMLTTASSSGISTSLQKDGFAYVVSTVRRKIAGSFYQTAIMKMPPDVWKKFAHRGREQEMVYRIEVTSQLDAVREHIDTVHMAVSNPEHVWLGTKAYQDDIMNDMSLGVRYPTLRLEMAWTDKRIVKMISDAGINYKQATSLYFKASRLWYLFLLIIPITLGQNNVKFGGDFLPGFFAGLIPVILIITVLEQLRMSWRRRAEVLEHRN